MGQNASELSDVLPAAVPYRPGRQIRAGLGARSAADAIGPLSPGCSIFALGAGGFTVADVLAYLLDEIGPASLTIATWTAGRADIWRTSQLLTDGRVRSLRLLTDKSLPHRNPAYFAALLERYGPASVCLSNVHCKFAVLRNAAWSLVLRTSSNLDAVCRLESFDLDDDAELARYLETVVDAIFAEQAAGRSFDQFVAAHLPPARTYFGDGVLDADLRRAGWTHAATGRGLA
ncbi:MAG TPA: hypothetical protein VES67_11680 [Vicinamibacterales bacterium]|nr:hypothetical protein [Vicinamibacterales bacterium]